jgi:hypothetical protein
MLLDLGNYENRNGTHLKMMASPRFNWILRGETLRLVRSTSTKTLPFLDEVNVISKSGRAAGQWRESVQVHIQGLCTRCMDRSHGCR